MLNSPFRWVGGKSRLRKHILPLITPHSCYVEPFAGAAWVLFGKQPSPVEVINDIDQDLITFFRVVKQKPKALIDSFRWSLVSRAEFQRLATQNPYKLTDVQRAHRFYYLIMAGWGGELRYPRFQTSISDGGHGNRLAGALQSLDERLSPIHKRLRTVLIENLTWQECIDRYDSDRTFMYIDPPYPGNGVNYVHNMRDWESHQQLANRLAGTKCKWIVSSYDTAEIRALFAGHTILRVQAASGMDSDSTQHNRTVNRELLILNYSPSTEVEQSVSQQRFLEL